MEQDSVAEGIKAMESIVEEMPERLRKASKAGKEITLSREFDRIVVAGMGGSALPGEIIKSLLGEEKQVMVVRDYSLPKWLDSRALVFAISYSGNTEETISMFRHAAKITKNIVVASSGGKLEELAKRSETPFVKLQKGIPPRMAYPEITGLMLNVLSNAGLMNVREQDYEETAAVLKKPAYKELAKDLARKINGRIPLLYSSSKLWSVSYKWKINFNENSNIPAFANLFPEWNHNELNGFLNSKDEFYAVFLRDDEEHFRIRKRMRLTKEILKEAGIPVTEIVTRGTNLFAKIFSTIYIGDLVSLELCRLNNTNPLDIPLINELKQRLEK